ncbi:uncharacterized protein LOC113855025 isoform X2 [Abrus precatorius]|uniref:Uncharacterized protein LOC113855025 isoform X2 n=1 Tax=Abrus precatorius TaxID=3816 RepID=A0A8B8KH43_ABRPR|nr:uncharacterized protein LOC113855025 isoform X2 [Abrus precatorius]
MAMDVKGITWVGNIYQKFENMCLEVEDAMFEETVKYVENQMLTVGESVKKIYSDVMQDLLPPSIYNLDETPAFELPIDQYTDAGFSKKSFQGSKKITVKADTNQTTEDSRINRDVYDDVIHTESCDTDTLFMSASCNADKGNSLISHARQYVGSSDVESNLASYENQHNKNMSTSKAVSEITLSKTDTCSTLQACELSNVNQHHVATVSKPASAEEPAIASVADRCNEIENADTKEIPRVLILVKSAEGKEMNTSSNSSVLFGDPNEITGTRSLDVPKIDTVIEHDHKAIQQDEELKLEETCVMVTRDELQSVPTAGGNLINSKNKRRQSFSLSKKSARKQEYEELAIWHENNEKEKGDSVENFCPTLPEDQKKLLLLDISEPEWELL